MSESKRFDWRDWFSAYRVRSRLILNFGLPDTDRIKCDSIELGIYHIVVYSILSMIVGNWGILAIAMTVDAFILYRQNKKYLRENLGGYPMVECSMAIHLAWFSKVRRFAAYVYLSDNDDNLVIHFSIPWLIELEISLDTPETILGQFITSTFLLKRKDRSRKGLRRFFKSNGGSFFTGIIITWDSFTLGFLHNEMDSSAQTCLSFQIFVDYSLDDTLMGSYTPVSRNEFVRDNANIVRSIIACKIPSYDDRQLTMIAVVWYEETQSPFGFEECTKIVLLPNDYDIRKAVDFVEYHTKLINESTLIPDDIKQSNHDTSMVLANLYRNDILDRVKELVKDSTCNADEALQLVLNPAASIKRVHAANGVITLKGKVDLVNIRLELYTRHV